MSGAHKILNQLKAGNARYVAEGGLPRNQRIDRVEIASRTAIATVLTCSDIKVVPEQVFGLEIGNLDVIQAAAGVCIEPESFGIETHGDGETTWLIVVLGHTPCDVIESSLANWSGPLNRVIEIVLERRTRLISAGASITATSVCEAHVTSTTQELTMSLDPKLFRVVAAHLDESNGVVRFLADHDPKAK